MACLTARSSLDDSLPLGTFHFHLSSILFIMTPMPSVRTVSVVLTILFLMPLFAIAGSETVQNVGFVFDVPDGVAFREYPSIPGGRFIPAASLGNRSYYAVMRLDVFWDQWPELGSEPFIRKWAVLACAADGADSSQWCEEESIALEPFVSDQGAQGYQVRRARVVESYSETGNEKKIFTDLIIAFDIKNRQTRKIRLAAFVCEDESCFDLTRTVGKSFRVP